MTHHYGWKPSLPDHRDHLYSAHWLDLVRLPASVDLRASCPPVYDQGQIGACTSNAIAGAIEFDMLKQLDKDVFTPSRLFIYYNESFESAEVAQTGVVPMPGPSESLLGGHAVLACGYRDDEQVFIFRNSRGTGWNPNDSILATATSPMLMC